MRFKKVRKLLIMEIDQVFLCIIMVKEQSWVFLNELGKQFLEMGRNFNQKGGRGGESKINNKINF